MAAIPYMPLYVADYLADAAHLSTMEHGAYLLLIMTYWQRGEALPNNDKKLARICRIGPREWNRIKPVISEFFQVGCDSWSHSRIDLELSKVRDKSLKNRKGGLARAKQMHSERSATAKPSDTDTDTYIPLSKDNGAKPASDKVFWENAKAHIGGNNPGALIGKWCRDYGKIETSNALTASQLERPVDPIAYVTGVLRKSKSNGKEEWRTPC